MPTDDSLTFVLRHVDAGIPIKELMGYLRSIVRTLETLDADMSTDHKPTSSWVITRISYSSPLTMTVEQRPLRGRLANDHVAPIYMMEMDNIQHGIPTQFLSSEVLETTRAFLKAAGDRSGSVAIAGPKGFRFESSSYAISRLEETVRSKFHKEYTTVEGKLDTIDVHNKLRFDVYDVLTGRPTKCSFDKVLYDTACMAIGKRVAVSGEAVFNERDDPVSMEAEELSVFRDDEQTSRLLEGKRFNITDGMDAVEYIRRLRDES